MIMIKLSTILGAAGTAILAGLLVATVGNADAARHAREAREACLAVGEVAQNCDDIVPQIPTCHEEDCSDISGSVGFWRDADGRLYLTRAPHVVIVEQSAS